MPGLHTRMDAFAGFSKADFVEKFENIFEYSPWVVERAWDRRPFADIDALHAAFMAEITAAGPAAQLDLIRAHPDLATSVALTRSSESEQTNAGLKHLTPAEFEQFAELNCLYRVKFGFPFIICVGVETKTSILAAFETRLRHDAAAEHSEALAQIGLIAKMRLLNLVEGAIP